ncbi:hypothetical protein GCM10017750_69530 [Streptomyces racemochromogenes]
MNYPLVTVTALPRRLKQRRSLPVPPNRQAPDSSPSLLPYTNKVWPVTTTETAPDQCKCKVRLQVGIPGSFPLLRPPQCPPSTSPTVSPSATQGLQELAT